MPLVIKPAAIHIKDDNGNYYPQNIVAEKTTEEYVTKVTQEGTKQVTAVNSAGSAQVSAVQNKGDTVLASIPSDYTSLQNDVDSLRDDFNELYVSTRNINTQPCGRYKITSGSIASANDNYFGMADMIPCEPNTEYAYYFRMPETGNCSTTLGYFDENKTLISSESGGVLSKDKPCYYTTTPATAKYIYVTAYRGSGITIDSDSDIQIELGFASTPYIKATIEKSSVDLDGTLTEIQFDAYPGYYTATGEISNASSSYQHQERYTQKFDMSVLGGISFDITHETTHAMWICCVYFDANGDFISRSNVYTQNGLKLGFPVVNAPSNAKYVAFTYRTFDDATIHVRATGVGTKLFEFTYGTNEELKKVSEIANNSFDASIVGYFAGRFKPCYDHLFVNDVPSNTPIPHESVYHVRLSHRLGFNVIEANLGKTSDGVFVVNHLANGKFGAYFNAADGVTDISDIAVSSKTWEWIVENARYATATVKYRTRPSRLEEFLGECRQQNIIPFIYSIDPDAIEIANSYMGKGNYIAYGASRKDCPYGIIYHWQGKTTKEDILAYCESVGRPFIYGMSNPTAFTSSELIDIVNTLHENGFWIGTSYANYDWYKYSYFGFDLNGTQTGINRITDANICNLSSEFGFDDFTFTNATETNGVLTYSDSGTLVPTFECEHINVGGFDLQIEFTGEITVPAIGKHGSTTYTSDGSIPLFVCAPIFDGSPQISIAVASGTVVLDCSYKVSEM